jgi:hypothetical protein
MRTGGTMYILTKQADASVIKRLLWPTLIGGGGGAGIGALIGGFSPTYKGRRLEGIGREAGLWGASGALAGLIGSAAGVLGGKIVNSKILREAQKGEELLRSRANATLPVPSFEGLNPTAAAARAAEFAEQSAAVAGAKHDVAVGIANHRNSARRREMMFELPASIGAGIGASALLRKPILGEQS